MCGCPFFMCLELCLILLFIIFVLIVLFCKESLENEREHLKGAILEKKG